MNYIWAVWLIAGALLTISEIFTPTFFLLPIGLGCVVSSIFAYFLPLNLMYVSILVFMVFTSVMLIFLRPICIKYLYGKNTPKSNMDAMIGKVFFADTDITEIPTGTIKIYADLWKAKTEHGTINAGEQVRICRVEGNILIVEKI